MGNKLNEIHRLRLSSYEDWDNELILYHHISISEPFKLHWHDCYEIEYIINGHGYQYFNGSKYELKHGTLNFITPSDFHELIIEEETEFHKFMFDVSSVNPFILNSLSNISGDTVFQISEKELNHFDSLFKLVAEDFNRFKDTTFKNNILKNYLECTLLNILKLSGSSDISNSKIPAVNDMNIILTYIHQNFRKKITLKEVAEHAHFSPNYLSKIFHNSMGITFQNYIKKLRLNFASNLLANSKTSITDICYESGFGSLSNFINEFKKEYTISPSEYKKKNI